MSPRPLRSQVSRRPPRFRSAGTGPRPGWSRRSPLTEDRRSEPRNSSLHSGHPFSAQEVALLNVSKVLGLIGQAPTMVRVLGSAGVIRPYPPHKLAKVGAALTRWGTG